MPSPAAEVHLQRITLRGTAAAIDHARHPLRTALEHADWPGTAPDELLLLRRIDVRGGSPHEIASHAAAQARRLAALAVDGWSATAPDALAVRFRNRAGLLACLLRDLLQGTVPQRWYWRRWQPAWQRPAGEAIVALLQEAPLQLPAVAAQLRTTAVWQDFWRQLGRTGGEQLLLAAAHATGWGVPVQAARTTPTAAATPLPGLAAQVARPFDLAFLAPAADDPRPLLAALLALWQQAPALLRHPAGPGALRALARHSTGRAPVATQPAPLPTEGQYRTPVTGPIGMPTPTGALPGMPVSPAAMGRVPPPPHDPTPAARANCPGGDSAATAPHQGDAAPAPPPQAHDQPAPITETLVTATGGLFYLLNFLNLPAVQPHLAATAAADLPGLGWRWLHGLGTALGCPPDGALQEFLARASGLADGATLAQQAAPPQLNLLLRLGAARYGTELWQAGTWRLPARLIAGPAHLDLHFHLNDTRLAVRRAGLDLNPGWLPWLGRVVTFHYGSGLEPAP